MPEVFRIKQSGFTLVELVIVMILLGLLAAFVIPRLTSKSSFEEHAVRDQLISRLRLAQMQSMAASPVKATGNECYWVVVKQGCFYTDDSKTQPLNGICPATSPKACDEDDRNFVTFSPNVTFPGSVTGFRFDNNGKLVSPAISGSEYTFAVGSVSLNINTEGYISAAN